MKLAVALALAGGAAALRPAARATRATVRMGAEPLSQQTGKYAMDQAVLDKYAALPRDKIQAEYVFIDADCTARSKCRTLDAARVKQGVDRLPKWTYDGSSTGQAPGDDSEVIIVPRAVYKDPFRGGDNILVLCDTYDPEGNPLPTNSRAPAVAKFEAGNAAAEKPWYGLEQEYTLFNLDGVTPLGWPVGGFPKPQGPYYCGAGADKSFGRAVSDAHYAACLYAGLGSRARTPRSCPASGSTRSAPPSASTPPTSSRSRAASSTACEDLGVSCPSTPSPSAATGTARAAT